MNGVDTFAERKSPRKAKKYVYFDATSGVIVFEYGGVQTPFLATKSNG